MPVVVNDIMSRDVICIDERSTVKDASQMMAGKGISSLLVVNDKKIVGILTEKDIVSKFVFMNKQPSDVLVSEIMSNPIITVAKDESLGNAANLMINNNIKKLPVCDTNNGYVVGIISIYDIVMNQPQLINSIHKGYDDNTRKVRHDVRGALFTLNTSITLLEKSPDKTMQLVDIMKKSTKYINDILEEWKNNEDKIIINRENIKISDLFKHALKTVYIPSNIRVTTSIKGEDVVNLDYNKMIRVINNLIKNSIEAMDGEGAIELVGFTDKEKITILVNDTGHGIKPEVIGRIFDPMFSTKSSGLGLGLSYVKDIVEAHEGVVSVKSEVKKGTEFTLLFPRIKSN
jgi:signal transduction histidine kinase